MYTPQSGEVLGVLKQLRARMTQDLEQITQKEEQTAKSSLDLLSAKKEEIESLTGAIEQKMARAADISVSLARQKTELASAKKTLAEDTTTLANLKRCCASADKKHKIQSC